MFGREGGEEEGQWVLGKGSKSGVVNSEHGQQGQSFAVTVHTKSHHSKKEGYFYINPNLPGLGPNRPL